MSTDSGTPQAEIGGLGETGGFEGIHLACLILPTVNCMFIQ